MVKLFQNGWKFYESDLETQMEQAVERFDKFYEVDLPHDWLIYDAKDLYKDSTGWYYKKFEVDEVSEKRILLRFNGVYMDSTIYINRNKVYEWKYGYSTFTIDVTQYLKKGENEVLVQVRHQAPNSRWYSGAGIYRSVWIKTCGNEYLIPDGTYVSIREKANDDSCWNIDISTEIAGDIKNDMFCRYTLLSEDKSKECLGQAAVDDGKVHFCSKVQNPKIWDIENPNCYRLLVELCNGLGEVIDTDEMTVGFRTIEMTTDKGLFLNHKNLKLHGTCEHHDLGCLGAAFNKEAMRRRMKLLKEMGVNALRTSHNMPAPEFMELADEMGFLVVDEAFDMWEKPKTKYDYARFFPEWYKKDVESWVRRDRNHPSLLMWSIGNEIYDTHADEHGQEITKNLMNEVKVHDYKGNASVTIGSNYMPWENARKCADIVKIAGYNYGEKYYEEHHKEHPDWFIYGSETSSIVQSRSVYHFPLSKPCLAEIDMQCSSLGNSTTSWGAQSIEKLIADDRDCEYSMGQFLWTGFDYIGEPTPYHTKNAYFGQIDTAGFPKDAYYVFQASWRDAKTFPMVHLYPYWDWNDGQLVDVLACTNGDSVELFVNGVSKGRQNLTHKNGSKLLGKWQVAYERGEICAVAYDKEGRKIAEEIRHSFGDSAKIILKTDKTHLKADGEDVCFITIEMQDKNGYLVENAMDYVKVNVDGAGRLLGLDNGDSTDVDSYKSNCRKLFNGKLSAVIGAIDKTGEIKVNVEALTDGIAGENLVIFAEKSDIRDGISYNERYDKDYTQVRIPARKIEIRVSGKERVISPQNPEILLEAELFPKNTTDRELVWEAVNDAGIKLEYVDLEVANDTLKAKVTARGDGNFRIRCAAKDSNGQAGIISQLEFSAEGFGEAFLNPYGYISAGLYTSLIGEVTNGNEKGIATSRDGKSGAVYENIDFGEYGSDTITIDVFALSDEPFPIEIWERDTLIDTVVYQKPSIWNTYQAQTWKLPVRLKNVTGISFIMNGKAHIKGFSFEYMEKSWQKLTGGDCSRVYGDSFNVDGESIKDIGNNVTIVYENMDFGDGAQSVTIWGETPLEANTIHIRMVRDDGSDSRIIAEYPGGENKYTFPVNEIRGKGKLELIFLPGSAFTFHALKFKSFTMN